MTVRRRVRRLLDRLAAASGLLARAERGMRRRITILTYHRILPAAQAARYPFPSLAIPAEAFREHVAWLAAHCTVLPLGEALAAGAGGGPPVVALTFDDGYEDNFLAAAPILEASGLRGTFFATVRPIEQRQLLWFDRAALLLTTAGPERLGRALAVAAPGSAGARPFPRDLPGWVELLRDVPHVRRPELLAALEAASPPIPGEVAAGYRLMTAENLVELSRRGHEIASHTLSHPFLTGLEPDRLRDEVGESRRVLSGWLGREVRGFCYPAGDLDEGTARAVRDAGYHYACTTEEGPNRPDRDPLRLRRSDVTSQRVTEDGRTHEPLGFRLEVCGLRHGMRRLLGRAP